MSTGIVFGPGITIQGGITIINFTPPVTEWNLEGDMQALSEDQTDLQNVTGTTVDLNT